MRTAKAGRSTSRTHASAQTLLDEVGRMTRRIDRRDVEGWRKELDALSTSRSRKEQLRIWLAEYALRGELEPERALNAIDGLLKEMPKWSPLRGTAIVDLGIMQFATGRYRSATNTLRSALRLPVSGIDRKSVAALARHAGACASYHETRAAAGITEPTHIDPLCGATGLAVASLKLGRKHEQAYVVSKTPHTGFGSNLGDLVEGARNLGLRGHPVSMSEAGLKAYFKINGGVPVIAHVEHDHFITVVGVSAEGVSYKCSDCGAWPGGDRTVTWSQWRMMDADAYLAVCVPGSDLDQALDLLPRKGDTSVPLLAMSSAPILGRQLTARAQQIFRLLQTAAVTLVLIPYYLECGFMPSSNHCDDCTTQCPIVQIASNLATADPVNVANGAEVYTAPGGLDVYNASGPGIGWTHSYNSLAQVVPNGWGQGWHHPYLLTMYLSQRPAQGAEPAQTTGYLIFPNSARMEVNFTTDTAPTSGQSHSGTVSPGFPYAVKWVNWSSVGGEKMEVTSLSGTRYYFSKLKQRVNDSQSWQWYLTSIVDRNDLKITVEWTAKTFQEFNLLTRTYDGYALSAIKDSSGSALLELNYDSQARLTSVDDKFDRSIYYTVESFANENVPSPSPQAHDELTQASIVVETGTSSPVVQYEYDYALYGNQEGSGSTAEKVPYLTSIETISPTGGSTYSQATVTYSSDGYVTKIEDANGNSAHITYNSGNSSTVEHKVGTTLVLKYTYGYDSYMNWTSMADAEGDIIITRYLQDSETPYRPTAIKLGDPGTGIGTPGSPGQWTFDWDSYSQILSVITPKSVETEYTRSYSAFPLGRVTEVQEGSKTSTQMTYYEPSGLVHEVKTPIPGESGTNSRQTTTYSYDSLGNVTSVVSPANNAGSTRTVSMGYGSSPKVGQPLTVTDPLGKVTTYTYNSRGTVASVEDPLGNTSNSYYTLSDQLDYTLAPATGSTGSGRAKQDFTYLFEGGPLTTVDAYDENSTLVRTVEMTYGHEGELLTRTGSTEPVTLTYDGVYHTKTITDGNSNTTTYTYNTNGHPTLIAYPGATGSNFNQVQFTDYDVLGRLLEREDGRGQVTQYTYGDDNFNLSDISYASDSSQDVAITYDAYDRVTAITDGAGSSGATYDDLGLTLTSTRTYTGLSAKTATYEYYPDGSRESMVNLAGTWEYLYDLNGRCTSMSSPAGTSGISYLDNGWISSRTLPNGSYTQYTYNAVGLQTALSNKKSDGTVQSSFGSTSFDGVFNLTAMTASISTPSSWSGSRTWTYDTKDRLTNETSTQYTSGWNHTNAFDGASNPTTFKGATLTYNSANQLTTGSMTYDGNGNPTTYGGKTLTFDVENRVTSVGSDATHGYRSDGLRAWKQPNGLLKTYYLYDGGNPIVELDASGSVANVNVFAPDGLVARKEGSTWNQFVFDLQGNTVQKLTTSQSVSATRLTDAWGEGVETTTPKQIDPFLFNGKWGYYYDRETALYLCQHRMYDASAGRWINRDPIGYAGGMNLYGYCGGGPVGSADPWGLSPVGDFFGGVGRGLVGGLRGTAEGYVDVMRWQAMGALSIPEQWDRFQQIPGQVQHFGENLTGAHGAGGVGEAIGQLLLIPLTKKVCELAPVVTRTLKPSVPKVHSYDPVMGVPLDESGFPIFDVLEDVIIKPTGSKAKDFAAANAAAGLEATPYERSWHHHQDYGRMQLVDRAVHGYVRHRGGWSIWGNKAKE